MAVIAGAVSIGIARPTPAYATHNRATQLEWVKGAASGQVDFTATLVARFSYYDGVVDEVSDTFHDPTLEFGDGTSEDPEFIVLDIDRDNDVLFARAAPIVHAYDSDMSFVATLSSCCRLSSPAHINNPDGDYQISTRVDLADSDASPIPSVSPVVDCPIEGTCFFRVTAVDPRGRSLRWRLADAKEAGSDFVQPGPPNATHAASIDPDSGLYQWNTAGATLNADGDAYYSTQVIVETMKGAEATSWVAVDFFIRLTADSAVLCSDTDADGNPDNDGDALCDNWEDTGIPVAGQPGHTLPLYDVNDDGTVSADERADKNIPDIYVEVDWMTGRKPSSAALANVVKAFKTPNANSDRHPVRLHIALAPSAIPHSTMLSMSGCDPNCPADTADFDELKESYFGTPTERAEHHTAAKALAFHYAVFGDRQSDGGSGVAEIRGNDFVVSLGGSQFTNDDDEQAGTFMHELGHNLGLLHGGGDPIGCKPNYISVMNYTRQFASWYHTNRRLDYSDEVNTLLDESSLSEEDGILNGPHNTRIAYGRKGRFEAVQAQAPIDWNFTKLLFGDGIDKTRVNADINTFPVCRNLEVKNQKLVGWDDWAHLVYDFRASNDYAEGVHSTIDGLEEVSEDDVAPFRHLDYDGDGIDDLADNCSTLPNKDQADKDLSGIGDLCEPSDPTVPGDASRLIEGTALVGAKLTAPPLTDRPKGAEVSYRWYRGSKPISKASGSSYRVTRADLGRKLKVRTTVAVGNSGTRGYSAPTATVKLASTLKASVTAQQSAGLVKIKVSVTWKDGRKKRHATGKVQVINLNNVVIKRSNLKKGRATATLRSQPAGRQTYRISYLGTSRVAGSQKTYALLVR